MYLVVTPSVIVFRRYDVSCYLSDLGRYYSQVEGVGNQAVDLSDYFVEAIYQGRRHCVKIGRFGVVVLVLVVPLTGSVIVTAIGLIGMETSGLKTWWSFTF